MKQTLVYAQERTGSKILNEKYIFGAHVIEGWWRIPQRGPGVKHLQRHRRCRHCRHHRHYHQHHHHLYYHGPIESQLTQEL